MIGEKKKEVLDKLKIENAEIKTIGAEEYYTAKVTDKNTTVIFTKGICSCYSETINDINTTDFELFR
jgi:hypothetical protein